MRGNYMKQKQRHKRRLPLLFAAVVLSMHPYLGLLFLFAERLVRFHYRASTLYQVRQAPENSGDNSPHFLLHYSPDSS